MNKKKWRKIFEISQECADRISATFKKPIELEFEKVMYPFILFAKKRYACLVYTNPEKDDGMDCKGIELVRRDNCPLVRKSQGDVLNKLLYNKDVKLATKTAKKYVSDLLHNKIDVDELIISKTLRHDYTCICCGVKCNSEGHMNIIRKNDKNYKGNIEEDSDGEEIIYTWGKRVRDNVEINITKKHKNEGLSEAPKINIPHKRLAEKLKERDPMNAPKSGDRVPYVFIETKNPKALTMAKNRRPFLCKRKRIKTR